MPALPNIRSAYLSWNPIANTNFYVVGVCEGTARGGPGLQQYRTSDTSIKITGLKDCQWYYYEVVAVLKSGAWAPVESGTFLTVVPAANLQSSVSGANVSLSWSPPCGSLWNEQWVDIGKSPGASDVFSANVGVGTAWYDVPMSFAPGTYYWRVNNKFGYTWFPSQNASFIVSGPSPTPTPATNLKCSSP